MNCLAAVLVRRVVALLPVDAVIRLVADDTVDGKNGDRVWAKSAPSRRGSIHARQSGDQVRAQVAGDVRAGSTQGVEPPLGVADPVRLVHQSPKPPAR